MVTTIIQFGFCSFFTFHTHGTRKILKNLETFAVDRSTALTKENEKLKQELKQVKEE